ncbi:hypothetical protein E2C01_070789 [Portunus trituberculatus]|uniref:Uncharacterized protein n=1 Tax=Portunus trituberculatus TaxID=210409 RepID=A0A5B7HV45_PORTR|nr:hypothetical protein [Portunus trituberculatus]
MTDWQGLEAGFSREGGREGGKADPRDAGGARKRPVGHAGGALTFHTPNNIEEEEEEEEEEKPSLPYHKAPGTIGVALCNSHTHTHTHTKD